MYLRYAERKGFKVDVLEQDDGEIAGVNRATIRLAGRICLRAFAAPKPACTAWCAIRLLIRTISATLRFSSVFVYPEVDDSIEIDINPADLRIDTYRASGAGGQHINKTDPAVRITHEPSRHRGAMPKRPLATRQESGRHGECCAQNCLSWKCASATRKSRRSKRAKAMWAGQPNPLYVLDSSRIKDLRTGHEVGNTKAVLDGDLDGFIEASLKQGVVICRPRKTVAVWNFSGFRRPFYYLGI